MGLSDVAIPPAALLIDRWMSSGAVGSAVEGLGGGVQGTFQSQVWLSTGDPWADLLGHVGTGWDGAAVESWHSFFLWSNRGFSVVRLSKEAIFVRALAIEGTLQPSPTREVST